MTDQEVNKIIAEFMGVQLHEIENKLYINVGAVGLQELAGYTESLDALVPVWEKLRNTYSRVDFEIEDLVEGEVVLSVLSHTWIFYKVKFTDKVEKAAAHATAKAINELRGNDGPYPVK